MAVNMGAKVLVGVTLLILVAFLEMYVFSLPGHTSTFVLRFHFVFIIEILLFLLSRFVWANYKHYPELLLRFRTEFDHSNNKRENKSDGRSIDEAKRWTIWQSCLFTFLVCCHLSYILNCILVAHDPYVFGYFCYAPTGLLLQLSTGMAIIKSLSFVINKIISPKTFLTKVRELQIALIFALVIWTSGVYMATTPSQVKEVTIPVKDLPKSLQGTKIVQMSDIHLGPTVGRWRLNRIVNIVNSQHPDIVVMTGDLVDNSVKNLKEAVEPFVNVQSKLGKYFVSGNHEYYTGDVDNWFDHLTTLGFTVLHNSNVKLPESSASAQQMCLAGVDDIEALTLRYDGHGMDLKTALGSCDPNQPVVLLAHQPRGAKMALDSEYRVDLVLSGHTHGGQFFPLNWIVHFFHPFFRGLYTYGKSSHVYVSVGTQYFNIPVRGASMEITNIILTGS